MGTPTLQDTLETHTHPVIPVRKVSEDIQLARTNVENHMCVSCPPPLDSRLLPHCMLSALLVCSTSLAHPCAGSHTCLHSPRLGRENLPSSPMLPPCDWTSELQALHPGQTAHQGGRVWEPGGLRADLHLAVLLQIENPMIKVPLSYT